jgi:hypothetical protein
MRTTSGIVFVFISAIVAGLTSCERDFDIKVNSHQPKLVVEAYINNELPLYNYVILGRSQDYYAPDFTNVPVTGARVAITEGRLISGQYEWDASSRKELKEAALPQLSNAYIQGVYFDTTLRGTPGMHYLLEIEVEGKLYSATTELLQPLSIDSITSGYYFIDEEDDPEYMARLTVHFKDPDTIGNTQLYYWRTRQTGENFGWGALGTNRYSPRTDELVNGQYMHITHSNGFDIGDTVSYHLVNVERKVYNFWDSYLKASESASPFSTPVNLQSTISGENVIGCFSGFSVNTKIVVVK